MPRQRKQQQIVEPLDTEIELRKIHEAWSKWQDMSGEEKAKQVLDPRVMLYGQSRDATLKPEVRAKAAAELDAMIRPRLKPLESAGGNGGAIQINVIPKL